MTEPQPVFAQVNVVVADMDATLAFYRRLGLDVSDRFGEWPPGSGARHVDFALGRNVMLEFDNVAGAKQPPYDAYWGARYAIIEDPDGNDVGLMSPIDPKRKFEPEP